MALRSAAKSKCARRAASNSGGTRETSARSEFIRTCQAKYYQHFSGSCAKDEKQNINKNGGVRRPGPGERRERRERRRAAETMQRLLPNRSGIVEEIDGGAAARPPIGVAASPLAHTVTDTNFTSANVTYCISRSAASSSTPTMTPNRVDIIYNRNTKPTHRN